MNNAEIYTLLTNLQDQLFEIIKNKDDANEVFEKIEEIKEKL